MLLLTNSKAEDWELADRKTPNGKSKRVQGPHNSPDGLQVTRPARFPLNRVYEERGGVCFPTAFPAKCG